MKVLILAGGLGTRLSEETGVLPKPMVMVGDKPILWHIMKTYSHFGFNDFVILLGYKGYVIKEFFTNYFLHQSDFTVDLSSGSFNFHSKNCEPWRVTLVDTGAATMTGARIKRAKSYVNEKQFMLTYGDGVADINISKLLTFHNQHGGLITMTSAQPEGRFGALSLNNESKVLDFKEKPKGDGSWVNAGFFVCDSKVFDYISDKENDVFEERPLEQLAAAGELFAYKHDGFWMPMDTLRDKVKLNELFYKERPWIVWEN